MSITSYRPDNIYLLAKSKIHDTDADEYKKGTSHKIATDVIFYTTLIIQYNKTGHHHGIVGRCNDVAVPVRSSTIVTKRRRQQARKRAAAAARSKRMTLYFTRTGRLWLREVLLNKYTHTYVHIHVYKVVREMKRDHQSLNAGEWQ